MTRRFLLCLVAALVAGCTPTGIDDVTSETWFGDLTATNSTMLMTVAHRGTTLSGSGGFTQLLVPGSSQSYTIAGTRRADTLDLLLTRSGESIRFLGWYLAGRKVLTGRLTGGDFNGMAVMLRKQ